MNEDEKETLTFYKDYLELQQENKQLANQNEELKQKLNWIAFGDEPELALRYLRKIGYVDFDEERKVYINKHNNEPFWIDDEEEKTYFIKDEELNDYTKQLEYKLKQRDGVIDFLNRHLNQRDEVIDETINHLNAFISDECLSKYDTLKILMYTKKILQKYKGDNHE